MSVGTVRGHNDRDLVWEKEIRKGWNRKAVEKVAAEMNLKYQCDSEQRPQKVSFHVKQEDSSHMIPSLLEKLEAKSDFLIERWNCVTDNSTKLIYSGGLDLDVVTKAAGKGQALAYIFRKLTAKGRAPSHTLVCGDSGNDAELFSVENVCGVIVANAQDELLQWHAEHVGDKSHIFCATERCAVGIIQAMQHFNLQHYVSPRNRVVPLSVHDKVAPNANAVDVAHEVVEYLMLMAHWLTGEIERSDEVLKRLKFSLAKDSTRVCAWGVLENPHEEIENLQPPYGSQRGKLFHTWADRVRSLRLSEDSWVVRFDQWERSDKGLTCALGTAVLQANVEFPNGLYWKLIHETWLKGYEGTTPIKK